MTEKFVHLEAETIQLRLAKAREEQRNAALQEQNEWVEKRLEEQSTELHSLQTRLVS